MDYAKSTHKFGKIGTLIACLLMLAVPSVITLAHPEIPVNISSTINAIVTLSAIYLPISIIEVISYSPVLGTGGAYLSFITGNIMNMKLPAATNALNVSGADRGSEEGEIISTLAIGASSIVTSLVVFLGMLFLGKTLVPLLTSETFKPAFDNIFPALLGALAIPSFLKDVKLGIVAILVGVIVYVVLGAELMASLSSFLMLPFIILVFCIYLIMYKTGIIKETGPVEK